MNYRNLAAGLCLLSIPAWLSYSQSSNLPGTPLGAITSAEQALFRMGLEDFLLVRTPGDGLGPAFNGNSCAICHNVPAIGGGGTISEIRGGYKDQEGNFTELGGGTLYHLFSTPPHACQVQMPAQANVVARRVPIPLFGAGLVEAIADKTILALEDPDDRDGDGISGRAARIIDIATGDKRVGRFGWKAQHATLLAFSGDAYRNEMGITNDLFPDEVALGVDPEQLRLCSPTRGVEDIRNRQTGLRGLDNFVNFMKLLAPAVRGPINSTVSAGESFFQIAGCTACHTQFLRTAPSANPLFDRKTVQLYSDLLLHDVGTGDGIVQADAKANEIRTPALWGLRFRRPLLHDGSAVTVHDAIVKHGGEAQFSKDQYFELPSFAQRALLEFLASL